jgi:chemotaxis protein histidine kinase CheA
MNVQEQLRALVERHLVTLAEQLATVARLLTTSGATLPVAQVVEAQAITHQLKGCSGSMGFADIGALASELDENLKRLKKNSEAIPAAELASTLKLLSALRHMADNTTPAMSKLYNADVAKLSG